ncbi:MAG: lipoyl(octanoyl) transferase LipB [Bacteroidota bacterium]
MKDSQGFKDLLVCNLGLSRYAEVWELQRLLFQLRTQAQISDVLILTEHKHVYTIGKSGTDTHLLASRDELQQQGVEVLHIDRGGDITYHGPGQLVAYPILDLQNYYLDVHRYLRDLEEAIIISLGEYGIVGERDQQYTGVWVGGNKLAAIGVKVSRWITMHGVAINVNTDLRHFGRIVPCGISGRGVTSVERVLSRRVELNEFNQRFVESFARVFECSPASISLEELLDLAGRNQREKELCPR